MKQFAVIGIGNFGSHLAAHLFEKGHDVVAVDKSETRIQEIKDKVSHAVVADTTDAKAVAELGLSDMDDVVVCVGSVLSHSILTVMNLLDAGVSSIRAMAISETHGRILNKLGVLEVFYPEKDQAISLGERLHNPNMIDYLPFLEGFSIIELAAPESFVGKKLAELNLINDYQVQVVAIKELVPETVHLIPTGSHLIKGSEILILLGADEGLGKLREKFK